MPTAYNFGMPKDWISDMTDEQFTKLRDIEGKNIVISDAFYYNSKKVGTEGVTFKFSVDGQERYATSFSEVILKQFKEGLMDALEKDDVIVRVCYKTSKNGKEYPMFCNAEE